MLVNARTFLRNNGGCHEFVFWLNVFSHCDCSNYYGFKHRTGRFAFGTGTGVAGPVLRPLLWPPRVLQLLPSASSWPEWPDWSSTYSAIQERIVWQRIHAITLQTLDLWQGVRWRPALKPAWGRVLSAGNMLRQVAKCIVSAVWTVIQCYQCISKCSTPNDFGGLWGSDYTTPRRSKHRQIVRI